MFDRIRQRTTGSTTNSGSESDNIPHAEHKSPDELRASIDELLDEIDEVLEENAAEFVAQYVQQGGE